MNERSKRIARSIGNGKSDSVCWGLLFQSIFLILLLVAPLLYYPHIQDFSNLPKTAFIQFASCLLLFIWVLKTCTTGKLELIQHPLMLVLLLWLAWSGLSILWGVDRFSGLALWAHWVACGICFFVLVNANPELKQLDRLLVWCVISATAVSLVGLLQYYLGATFIPQTFIPGSTFSNRNMAAQFVVMIWPLSMLLFILNKKRHLNGLYGLIHAILVIFIIITRTRAAWVAVLLTLSALLLFLLLTGFWREIRPCFPKGKAIVLTASLFFIATMVYIPPQNPQKAVSLIKDLVLPCKVLAYTPTQQKDQPISGQAEILATLFSIPEYREGSSAFRIAAWRNTFQMMRDHFFPGVGLSNWPIYYPLYQSASQPDPFFSLERQPERLHNDPLQLLAETSFVGLFLYLCLFTIIGRILYVSFRSPHPADMKLRLFFVAMSLMGFFVDSLFSFPLRMAVPPLYLMVLMGLVVCYDFHMRGKPGTLNILLKGWKTRAPLILICALWITLSNFLNARLILADGHYLKANRLNGIAKWKSATEEAESAVSYAPWRYKAWYELGKARTNLREYPKAEHAYNQTLNIHPNHINSLLNLGHAHMNQRGVQKAKSSFERALRIKPDFEEALMNMGLIHEMEKDTENAAASYRKILKINPENERVRFQLASIRLAQGKLAQARHHLEKLTEAEPHVPHVYFYLGNVYERLGMLEKAENCYEKEIAINPDNANAYNNLGLLLAKKGQVRALFLYEKAIGIKPDLAPAHLNLAIAYYQLKNYDLSRKHALIAKKLARPEADALISKLDAVPKSEKARMRGSDIKSP